MPGEFEVGQDKHPSRGLFITLDGVDGVGKTHTCSLLARKLKALSFKSPSEPFASMRSSFDSRDNPLARYFFFHAATQNDSRKIETLLDAGQNVICDRYIYSTYAYHVALNPIVESIHQTTGLLLPDLPVLLSAPSDIREERLARRRLRDSDYHRPLEEDMDYQNRVQGFFQNMGMFEVDTGKNNVTQCVAMILGELNLRFGASVRL